jgi:hypothetical protein
MLNKYDALLKGVREFDNYWSDVGMSDAIALLEDFTDEEWTELEKLLTDRPSLWQVSCAETLGEITDTDRGFELLLSLMRIGDEDVVLASLDSINALASTGLNITENAAQLRSAIGNVRHSAGPAVSRMLNALEEKLPPA